MIDFKIIMHLFQKLYFNDFLQIFLGILIVIHLVYYKWFHNKYNNNIEYAYKTNIYPTTKQLQSNKLYKNTLMAADSISKLLSMSITPFSCASFSLESSKFPK